MNLTNATNPSSPTGAPKARPPLLSLDEAISRLLTAVSPMTAAGTLPHTETVSTFDALGRVLAEDVSALVNVPPADNTSMDGYALRAADVPSAGTRLPLGQRIPAGAVAQALAAGHAARIFTGAQIPPGADAVVMQEDCELADGEVVIKSVPQAGQWIRRCGEDVRAGQVVLCQGAVLDAQKLGLAASVGAAELRVVRKPRVALFSTGDELVMPGTVAPDQLPVGTIFNSNRYTLAALIRASGAECTDLGIVPDRLDATREALRRAALGHDLILTSGGVSVGEEDHLRPAVLAEGRLDLWQMAIKPGKPLAFGAVRRGGDAHSGNGATASAGEAGGVNSVNEVNGAEAWFIGLPGNPVSSFVTFLVAVRPVLRKLMGATTAMPRPYTLRADFDWPQPDKRREFLRARRNRAGGLDLFANQSSGVLTSAVWADGLIDNPPGQVIRQGDEVAFLPFADFFG